jgi:hypothetical protein
MSRPHFVADEDFNFNIVTAVRRIRPEIEITTVVEAGWSHALGPEVLEIVRADRRILLTQVVQRDLSYQVLGG